MIFDFNKSETITGCGKMLEAAVLVLRLCGYQKDKHGVLLGLMDGSDALKSACIQNGIIPKRCNTHIFRSPVKKLGYKGYSGCAGSFYTFMERKQVPKKLIFIIRSVYFALSLVPNNRGYIYKIARKKILHDFDTGSFYGLPKELRSDIKKQLFTFYIPEEPSFGNCGIQPGLPKNTNS